MIRHLGKIDKSGGIIKSPPRRGLTFTHKLFIGGTAFPGCVKNPAQARKPVLLNPSFWFFDKDVTYMMLI
jgi:hypothetical protein